eukprot:COSAG01_NODE_3846_length_5644_cov_48.943192_3_plen_76_part_00
MCDRQLACSQASQLRLEGEITAVLMNTAVLIGGQEDVRGACQHRQALFLVPRGACGPGGAAGAEGGACYVRQVRA